MKKKLVFAALALFAITGFAQEKAIKNYGFWDNWFIQGQIGGSYTVSENHTEADFGDILTPHAAISIGKHFSPIAGARLQVGGWESKSYLSPGKTYKYNYIQTNLDALLNLTNLFSEYKGDRFFNLYGIMGIGYVHNYRKCEYVPTLNSIIPRVGMQADFRLSGHISLNIEGTANLMPDNFNGIVEGRRYDGTANVLAGITYRFNKNGFELVDALDPAQIDALNHQINKQKSELNAKDRQIQQYKSDIEKLANRPAVVEEIVTTDVQTEVLMNAVVVFKIGSAKLEQNQDINIYNAAKYLNENPNVKITLTGYADKATGTPAINQKLSQQRADAVANILMNKYGIAKNRITIKADGDNVQPFDIDSWNRVVIFTVNN